jgi:hypothetical protein
MNLGKSAIIGSAEIQELNGVHIGECLTFASQLVTAPNGLLLRRKLPWQSGRCDCRIAGKDCNFAVGGGLDPVSSKG